MKLTVTKQQFVILNQILMHVRLGDDNEFQNAISELAITFADIANDLDEDYPVPSLGITYNESEGLVIELE
jgi:hypothetical protein